MSDFENGNFSNDGYNSGYSYQQPSLEQPGENVIAGLVGAFLFSLAGGLLYFLIAQIGFIAGITGLVIVVLANVGYGMFSGCKNSKKGAVISLFMLVLVTVLAEYFCVAYEIFKAFDEEYAELGIGFFDSCKLVPDIAKDPEVWPDIVKDVVFSLGLGVLAGFSYIGNSFKGRGNR